MVCEVKYWSIAVKEAFEVNNVEAMQCEGDFLKTNWPS